LRFVLLRSASTRAGTGAQIFGMSAIEAGGSPSCDADVPKKESDYRDQLLLRPSDARPQNRTTSHRSLTHRTDEASC